MYNFLHSSVLPWANHTFGQMGIITLYIWGSYRPAKGPQDFQQLYFITLLHLIFMKITKVGFSLDLFHKNHFFWALWTYFRQFFGHIRGSCRPAKGPKIFINCILSHDYILYAWKSQKLNFHWIYSIKITFLSYVDPFQAVFRHIRGLYGPAWGTLIFKNCVLINKIISLW